jgi:hypothetical protein
MYYSYLEIEYVAMSFSPAREALAVKLLIVQCIKYQFQRWLVYLYEYILNSYY